MNGYLLLAFELVPRRARDPLTAVAPPGVEADVASASQHASLAGCFTGLALVDICG